MSTLLWAALGGIAMLTELAAPRTGAATAQLGVSLLALLFGLWVFWRHGGRQITAAGLYSLASAVFVGLAGLYWWSELGNEVPYGLYLATAFSFFTNLFMHRLFWRDITMPQQPPATDQDAARWGIAAGGAVSTVALLLYLSGASIGATLLGEIIFGGMALLIVSLVIHPGRRIGIVRTTAAGAVMALYATTVFTGYGRLLLVALGLAAVLPACLRLPGRAAKALVAAAIAPALAAFSYAREQFGVATYGATLDGTGSVTQPLADFGRLIELYQHGLLDLGYGSTLLVTVVFFVPRAIWPDKPLGFGAELTAILEPELVSINQSLAAHLGGEWFYDFGYLGLPAMVLVMGWAIAWLDGLASNTFRRPLTHRRALLVLVAVVILLAGIPDLQWAGTFTYWSRTASRLAVPAVLLVLAGVLPTGPVQLQETRLRAGRRAWRTAGESAARR